MENKYTFLAIADIHWGAMESQIMYDNLTFVIEMVIAMKNKIDFVVICGDYFDYRLALNSKASLLSIKWFDLLVNTCKDNGVKKIRIVKGTKDHDNDQLKAFNHYQTDDGYVKIYDTTTSELLFPNLRVLFAPDENINLREYHPKYYNTLLPESDIGFFHGNFDCVLPEIEYNRIQESNSPTMIYEYDKFARLVKGPLISGHWHIGQQYESLYYIGSYDRWKFGEEDDKGFIIGTYNTIDSSYLIQKISNPYTYAYDTITIDNADVSTPEDFGKLVSEVKTRIKNNDKLFIKVKYMISIDNPESIMNFTNFTKAFSNTKYVRTTIVDLIKRASKKAKKEQVLIQSNKYGYVEDPSLSLTDKIRTFVYDRKGITLSNEEINSVIEKYIIN